MLVIPRLACWRWITTSWNTFVRHLDRVRVPQLVRSEPSADARGGCRIVQLLACGGRLRASAGGRTVDHAEQPADRELAAEFEPRFELLPCPAVHPDFTSLAVLPAPDGHGTTGTVKVALLKSQRFADPQARAPEQHDQRAKPETVGAFAERTHDFDDFLDRRGVRRVLLALLRGGRPR